jgi:hypothetical protein
MGPPDCGASPRGRLQAAGKKLILKRKFQSQLSYTRCRRLQNMSEGNAVNITVYRAIGIKLGMIERVKRFRSAFGLNSEVLK